MSQMASQARSESVCYPLVFENLAVPHGRTLKLMFCRPSLYESSLWMEEASNVRHPSSTEGGGQKVLSSFQKIIIVRISISSQRSFLKGVVSVAIVEWAYGQPGGGDEAEKHGKHGKLKPNQDQAADPSLGISIYSTPDGLLLRTGNCPFTARTWANLCSPLAFSSVSSRLSPCTTSIMA